MDITFDDSFREKINHTLQSALANNNTLLSRQVGDRQPVHTVYGGAHLFKSNISTKFGEIALRNLDTYAQNFVSFARILGLKGADTLPKTEQEIQVLADQIINNEELIKQTQWPAWLAYTVYNRVIHKLRTEAIEDFRIDFEDGYGNRSDEEEDQHAIQASERLAEGMQNNVLPPFVGIRIKPLSEELKKRSIRTLDIFMTNLAKLTQAKLPNNFVVTLPKVTVPEQVACLAQLFECLEDKLNFATNSLKMEIMIETIESIVDRKGQFSIPMFVQAGKGKICGAHFGTYDYTASCNITAAHQKINHPVCDFARNVMQVTLAGTGIMISDGATTMMPIGPHRPTKDGPGLTDQQKEENMQAVHKAWKVAYDNICNSLLFGFYQGWDLNPAQLPIRYAAMYNFFLEGFEDASVRLKHFIKQAAQATLVGHTFDDAATGQGLLNYFLQAISCKALTIKEVQDTGLTLEEIKDKSFVKIATARRK